LPRGWTTLGAGLHLDARASRALSIGKNCDGYLLAINLLSDKVTDYWHYDHKGEATHLCKAIGTLSARWAKVDAKIACQNHDGSSYPNS